MAVVASLFKLGDYRSGAGSQGNSMVARRPSSPYGCHNGARGPNAYWLGGGPPWTGAGTEPGSARIASGNSSFKECIEAANCSNAAMTFTVSWLALVSDTACDAATA